MAEAVAFGDLLEGGTRNGIYKSKEFHGRGHKIVNMGELFAHPRLGPVAMERVELTESERERFELCPGDLLFARRSLVAEGAGRCSVVMSVDEPTTFESSIIRARPDPKRADSLFLYYLFSSARGAHLLDTIRRDAVVAGITGADLVRLQLDVPDVSTQRAIAEVLGVLDDKIELNRRMNETLDELGSTLFRSWFIDSVATDAERGSATHRLPTGWTIGTVDDAVSLVIDHRGKTPLKLGGDWSASGVPAISAKNVKNGRLISRDDVRFVDVDLYSRWMREPLKGGDVLLTSEAPLGELCYLPTDSHFCLSQRLYALRAAPDRCTPSFLYYWLRSSSAQTEMQARATGTTVLGIRQSELRKVRVPLPPLSTTQRFHEVVHPLLERQHANESESRILASVRDVLLPKLLSGELLTRDAERVVEAVA
ncbi:MAG: restriction endonuclease subunit S [Deltaproteobacteria bacterium]|nr:restriction endonuclease subunit S [Deltaproteobacteria bacterium]